MNRYTSLAVSFSLAAFTGSYAVAQQAQPDPAQQTQMQTQQQAQSQQAPQPRTAQRDRQMSPDQLRVSDLKGKDVYGQDGREIGRIDDVIVDMEQGRVHAVVIQSGGVFGIGGNNYAFPMTDLRLAEKDRLTLNVNKQRLDNAEGFAKGQWPEMGNEYWGRTSRQADASSSQTGTDAQASAGATPPAGGEGGQAGTTAQSSSKAAKLIRASDVIGKDVQDRAGEDVGQVEDVIVSLNDARIQGFRLDVDKAGKAMVEPKMLTAGLDDKLVIDTQAEELRRRAQPQQRRDAERSRTAPSTTENRPLDTQR